MPVSPQYKLIYFNGRGRGETIRLLFAQAQVKYEDLRIEREQWPALKESMPFAQLPVLEVDGKQLAQSHAIEKFLARMWGLDGRDAWESAKIDELNLALEDLSQKFIPWVKEQDEAKKIELLKNVVDKEVAPFFMSYDKELEKNGTGFFVGDQLSLADIAVFNTLSFFDSKLMPGHLKKYPHLCKFIHKIAQLPHIKEWIEKRPKTDF